MFDIGFAELVIIAVVALIVIGPERLPDAVRTASAWLNRLRRSFNEIKQEVQQELHNDAVLRELRESGEKLKRETQSLQEDLRRPLDDTDAALKADAAKHLGAASRPATGTSQGADPAQGTSATAGGDTPQGPATGTAEQSDSENK